MNNAAQDTQIDSFYNLQNVGKAQLEVLRVIEQYGPVCDKTIAKMLGWDIPSVNGRRNELFHDNKIQIAYKDKSPFTGKTVIFWDVKKEGQQTIL